MGIPAAKSAARLQRVQLAATAAMHGRDSILLDFAAPDKAADKKAAPTWGKPGAGAAEVNNARRNSKRTQVITSRLRLRYYAACQAPLVYRASVTSS
jgi:hypothetical protein